MSYIAIIPARKGSKEILGKNIKLIGGKPLIYWSIQQALNSQKISRVIVSTDCDEIAEISKKFGAEAPFLRPEQFSLDDSSTESVLIHAVKELNLENQSIIKSVILLQPTSPIRNKNSIDEAIKTFELDNSESLVSVNKTKNFFWKKNKKPLPLYDHNSRPMRQNLKEDQVFYRENGSIYITSIETLIKCENRIGGKISLFNMSDEEGFEIDSLLDFDIVNFLIKRNNFIHRKIKISDIDAIIFDFDGVLTDNKVNLSSDGIESVICDRSDGLTFEIFKKLGLKVFILSSEKNSVVKKRGQKLKVETISGSEDKENDLRKLCEDYSLNLKKIIYVGNDLNDIKVMKLCGISFAVNDAVESVKNVADFILDAKGGQSVAREILDYYIMK